MFERKDIFCSTLSCIVPPTRWASSLRRVEVPVPDQRDVQCLLWNKSNLPE